MTLDTYRRHRLTYEVGLWLLYGAVHFVANVGVVLLEFERRSAPFQAWEPVVWEGSSILVQLCLIPAIVWFDRRFPLTRNTWRRSVLAHAAFTIPFSLVHVLAMVGLRKLAYLAMGTTYDFGHWPSELFYEYLKDFRSYAGFVAIIYLYRFVLRRLQGEAEFLSEGREESEPAPVTDRFLVKKLGREFLVRVGEIDWVESSGNYVNLHVGERVYPLRETMTAIQRRLEPDGFLRVHRSAIVNLDRVTAIAPYDTGDGAVHLDGGRQVPVSRRYRKELRARIKAGTNGMPARA